MAIKKDKLYTKWIYDYPTEESDHEEIFSMDMYEYEFIFRGELDPPGSWFADALDSNLDNGNVGLYKGSWVYDSKIECIKAQIELLENYLASCAKHKSNPAFEIQAEDLAELEFFKRELQLEIESMGNKQ